MSKPVKVKCDFKQLGGHGATFDVHLHVPGFGRMKCAIRYDLESEQMLEVVVRNGREVEQTLDAMEIDPTSEESIGKYQVALAAGLSKLMTEVREALSSE